MSLKRWALAAQVVVLLGLLACLVLAARDRPPQKVRYSEPTQSYAEVTGELPLSSGVEGTIRITTRRLTVEGETEALFEVGILCDAETIARWRLYPIPSTVYVTQSRNQPYLATTIFDIESSKDLLVEIPMDYGARMHFFGGGGERQLVIQLPAPVNWGQFDARITATAVEGSQDLAMALSTLTYVGNEIVSEQRRYENGRLLKTAADAKGNTWITAHALKLATFSTKGIPVSPRRFPTAALLQAYEGEVRANLLVARTSIYNVGRPGELKVGDGRAALLVADGDKLDLNFTQRDRAKLSLDSKGVIELFGSRAGSVRIGGSEQLKNRLDDAPWYWQTLIGAILGSLITGIARRLRPQTDRAVSARASPHDHSLYRDSG